MPTETTIQFYYTAVNSAGARRRGLRVARDQASLADALSEDGLLLLSARRLPEWTVGAARLPIKDQFAFNEQLGQLLSRGVPLVEALDVAASVVSANVKEKVDRIRSLVRAGSSFADACQQAGGFDDVTVMVYRAAERTGDLAEATKRLAKAAQRRRAIAAKAGTLMIYPSIVMSVSVVIGVVVLTVVVPRIGAALAQANQELPWFTRIVMSIGTGLRDNGLVALLIVGAAVTAAVIGRRYVVAAMGPALRVFPPVARLTLAMESARFFSTMAAMTRSGVPLADALAVAAGAVSYPPLRTQLDDMRRRLVEGGLLRTLLENVTELPLATRRLLIAAERSGDLDAAFDGLADDMAAEVDQRSERLLAMLEPAMIIVMFALIGSLLLSIMIPMISITSGSSFG